MQSFLPLDEKDKMKEDFYNCPQCGSNLPVLTCPDCQLRIHTELDKLLTLNEMKDIMRKMLKEQEWNCDMLVERIFKAQEEKGQNETKVAR